MRSTGASSWTRVQRMLALLIAVRVACGVVQAHEPDADCTLGFIAGLSGPGSVYGIAPRRGVELALHDLNRPALRVEFEDDQFIPKNTVAAFQRLATGTRVFAVTVVGASSALAIAPLAERASIPLIAVASDERLGLSGSSVLRAWASGADEGTLLAQEATRRGLSPVVFLYDVDDYSRSVAEGFSEALTRIHASGPPAEHVAGQSLPLERAELPADLQDLPALLLRLSRMKTSQSPVAGIGICARAGRVGAIAHRIRAAGWSGEMFGCVTMENSKEVEASRGALRGAWFASSAVRTEFRARYLAQFGEENFLGGAAMFYDLTRRLDAICRSGTKDVIERLLAGGSFDQETAQALESLESTGLRKSSEGQGAQALRPKLVIRSIADW